jgi:hypothetical protein
MIYTAPSGSSFAPSFGSNAEREATPSFYVSSPASAAAPPPEFEVISVGEKSEFLTVTVRNVEDYKWNRVETKREYIRLEQKVLAGIADEDEVAKYKAMKSDRNSTIFADRYVNDYAELQRIQFLASKIAELQKFLRPIVLK